MLKRQVEENNPVKLFRSRELDAVAYLRKCDKK